MLLFFYLLLILLTECFIWSKSIPNGSAKSQNKLKYSSQAQKILPIDELHMRQNGFLLQLQAIYALHYSFAISFFYYFVFCSAPLSSFFSFFCLLCGCQSHGTNSRCYRLSLFSFFFFLGFFCCFFFFFRSVMVTVCV